MKIQNSRTKEFVVSANSAQGFHWGTYAVYRVLENGTRILEGTYATEAVAYDKAFELEKFHQAQMPGQ